MKVAIIGMGRMGKIHLQTAQEWGAEIVDPNAADVVVIASPDNTHTGYVAFHLKRGQHVFCEKPIATDDIDLNHIVVAGLKADAHLGCHLPLRQFAGEFEIQGNEIDLIYDYGRKTKFLNSWRNSSDYDLVMGGGIHLMDLWMLKSGARKIEVKWTSRVKVSEGAKCPDLFIGRFEAGPIKGTLTVDFTTDGPHRHMINGWINEKSTDKTIQLREFLGHPKTDQLALASHRACLELRNAQS